MRLRDNRLGAANAVVGCMAAAVLVSLSAASALAQETPVPVLVPLALAEDGWRTTASADGREITPDHLHRAIEDLIAEISLIRGELGVHGFHPEAELHDARAPIHVYAKALELSSKVNRVQNRFGITETPVGRIPFKVVDPEDVFNVIGDLLDAVRSIKSDMAVERQIATTDLAAGKTPAMIYKRLGDASFMLDGLRGHALVPDDVYRNASAVLGDIELVAQRLDVKLAAELPAVEERKRPVDVARQVLTAIRKLLALQRQMGMIPSNAPTVSLVRVTPSEVYDAVNALVADMARVKFQLGIDAIPDTRPDPSGMQPANVFALVTHIIDGLDRISNGMSEDVSTEIQERQAALIREQRQRESERLREIEAQRQAALEEQRQLELEQEAEQQRQEEERQREAERQQREAEQRRQEEEARQREAERLRQEEEARQQEAERLRQEEEAARLAQLEAEAQVPACQVLIDPNSDDFIPAYPQRSRRDLGTAVIMVSFEIDESGDIIEEAVAVIRERSSASKEDHFDKFAEAAMDTVRDWSPDFEEPDGERCKMEQTGVVTFRFEY